MKDGGQAFPSGESYRMTDFAGHKTDCRKGPLHMGMSLRDWFAGMALSSRGLYGANIREKEVSEECFKIADAMLAEREKGEAK